MILGCDAAGVDEDGNEVVVHGVIGDPRWTGDEADRPGPVAALRAPPGHLRRPGRRAPAQPRPQARLALLRGGGLPAHRVADRLPDALRAGRLQARRDGARPGRRRRRRHRAHHPGARGGPPRPGHQPRRGQACAGPASSAPTQVFESGERLPEKVDAVMETVGKATWTHSLRALRPGGRIVISGTTSGPDAGDPGLTHVFFMQLSIIGSTMGTRGELDLLVKFLDATRRPAADRPGPPDGRGPRRLRRDGGGRRLRGMRWWTRTSLPPCWLATWVRSS